MSYSEGYTVGVTELLREGKTPTHLVWKQRKTGLLHLSYLIFLPLLPLFLGWQGSTTRFQKRQLKRKDQGTMLGGIDIVTSAALFSVIHEFEMDCPTSQDCQPQLGGGLELE